jgi:hypothetical protein
MEAIPKTLFGQTVLASHMIDLEELKMWEASTASPNEQNNHYIQAIDTIAYHWYSLAKYSSALARCTLPRPLQKD